MLVGTQRQAVLTVLLIRKTLVPEGTGAQYRPARILDSVIITLSQFTYIKAKRCSDSFW